ncbi:hypothetical protein ACHAPT_009407 [Fusarium lateritium]
MIKAILTASNIPAIHLLKEHIASDRGASISRFNDKNAECCALVPSLQLGAFGINLHRACSTAIIVEQPPNIPTLLQAIDRLWRIGQDKPVQVFILHLQSSYDSFVDAHNLEKHAHALTAEADIDTRITGELRLVCAYEMMRRLLGQETDRYPRLRVPWEKIDHPLVAREGLFYSILAHFAMENPQHVQNLAKDKVAQIAASWCPGTDIGKDHVGLLPDLGEAGVKLYNFVMNDEEVNKLQRGMADEEAHDEVEVEEGDATATVETPLTTPTRPGTSRPKKRRQIGKKKI